MTDHDTASGATEAGERLQKYLARSGVASRRHAEELIAAGAVSVNGRVAREMGLRVRPGVDEVRVRGRIARPPETALYLMLNKPEGVVTTARDPQGRRTALDLLPPRWRERRVFPVGRLDLDTDGLLLLTTDGDLALRLTHPRYALPKEYHALALGRPDRAALDQLRTGVLLEGEARPTAPARIWPLSAQAGEDPEPGATWLGVEIHEGRKRQVRRMFAEVGYPLVRLRRVRVGPLWLGDLRPGAARELTHAEVEALQRATGSAPGRPARPESVERGLSGLDEPDEG